MDVVIATYGDDHWPELARHRAGPSAKGQGRIIYSHGRTLAEARNAGLAEVRSDFVIFLDADDELGPGYVAAMEKGTADLRAPIVQQVKRGLYRRPFMPQVWGHDHACSAECLRFGNWIVIGAAVRADLLRSVGGFEEWGWSEDWAAWARCWKAGGTVEAIPEARYIAHVREGSRNHALAADQTHDWHLQIEAAVWPEEASRVG